MRIAYVNPFRRWPEEKQIEFHEQNGVKKIYVEGRGPENFEAARRALRKGDALEVVSLRCLGTGRNAIRASYAAIRERGASVFISPTGGVVGDDGLDELAKSLAEIHGEASSPSKTELIRRAKKGGQAMKRKAANGRMAKREALQIWRDPQYSVPEAIALMGGWTAASAYRNLGKRGVPAGRRS